ncbi:MAG: hypothetical protein Q4A28_06250 [Brachymonas sp.]|nr:hypothetical protein [Brachymonas sp.]
MRTAHYFAPGTVVQLHTPRKPSRWRVGLRIAAACLTVGFLFWFWLTVFAWVDDLLRGLL